MTTTLIVLANRVVSDDGTELGVYRYEYREPLHRVGAIASELAMRLREAVDRLALVKKGTLGSTKPGTLRVTLVWEDE